MDRLTSFICLIPLLVATAGQAQGPSSVPALFEGYSAADTSSATPAPRGTASLASSRVADVVPGSGPLPPMFATRARHTGYRFDGGFEIGWLQPRFTENVSVVVSRPTGDRALAFEHPFEAAPRLWVGIQNAKGTGIRTRYWYFNSDAARRITFARAGTSPLSQTIVGGGGNLRRTAVANIGEVMTSNHNLEMRTIDLEGTQRLNFARTEMLASFGLRYAKTSQRAHAVATDASGSVTELVCQGLRFDGFGPTTSIEMTRCLFPCRPLLSRLSFYADARGSILFGQQTQEIVLVTGGGATLAEDEYIHDDLLSIAELSGGLQLLARPLGRGLWSLRTGYRAESWFGAGGPVDTQSNIGLHGIVLSLAAQW